MFKVCNRIDLLKNMFWKINILYFFSVNFEHAVFNYHFMVSLTHIWSFFPFYTPLKPKVF